MASLPANQRLVKANASTATTPLSSNTQPSHDHIHTKRKPSIVSTSNMDRADRTSFSSIKEGVGGIGQTFTTSKTSSYLSRVYDASSDDEEAIQDGFITPPEGMPGLQMERQQHAQPRLLHSFVCPCDGFQGWKGISLKGKRASRSHEDLRALGHRWGWASTTTSAEMASMTPNIVENVPVKIHGQYPPGQAPIESLPAELLSAVIDQLAIDIPPSGFTARNVDLMSLLLTSRAMHSATLATLYNNITIPHSRIFRKFLSHVAEHPALGTIVRRLDFSHFNPTGAGMTARERAQTLNLIPATLLQCLKLTPNLREFLAQEHIDDDLDANVIKTLLCDLPKLNALDFCACSSSQFKEAFTSVIEAQPCPLPEALPITRLSLHECAVLPSSLYSILLPRLPHLTHLDVAHTRITDSALASIPLTARLTHLNLSKCSFLSGNAVVDFLTNHPAAKTLRYLNLGMDSKSNEMLSSENITALLPVLPTTLKSLSLKGSKMEASHLPLILPLTKHVQELGLGRNLDLQDLCRLFVPDDNLDIDEQMAWTPHTMRYLDVSDLTMAQLDLGTLLGSRCPILKSTASPLEVIELSSDHFKRLEKSPAVKRAGWTLTDAGRRYWLVRIKSVEEQADSGAREWKWGACYWGMRKIPVARAEVGGMYGHYMFKR
ncbi:hypothetical protein HYFRA_00011679 [Hymenoscyphus fraxineus]|uniref:Leucine Rich Repeat domain protein n=1 Tax=Hymenoscyphus fraxineus TaxID=746836 RepID=A0A9N9KWT9_9HELO|nr:hypothetical protein HYFRA_00011679 [Hymenoscyphus fraxineus]